MDCEYTGEKLVPLSGWAKSLHSILLNLGATTECRATFKHSPNEPARLARQWMKGFIHLVARLARLARQWKNFYGVKC